MSVESHKPKPLLRATACHSTEAFQLGSISAFFFWKLREITDMSTLPFVKPSKGALPLNLPTRKF